MNKNLLIDAISQIDDNLLEDYFKTKHLLNKKKNSSFIRGHYRWISAACLILALTASITIFWLTSANRVSDTHGDVGSKNNTENSSNGIVTDDIRYKTVGNGLKVSRTLYEALLTASPFDTLTITVFATHDLKINDFVYNGKTYSEYYTERKNLETVLTKLKKLTSEGNYLKYGEALYTSGIPGGSKWSKESYEERISYYGVEMLEKYIVDSLFLETALKEDISKTQSEISNLRALEKTIENDYAICMANSTVELFKNKGYISYIVTLDEPLVLIELSKEDFLTLTLEKTEAYRFSLFSEYN